MILQWSSTTYLMWHVDTVTDYWLSGSVTITFDFDTLQSGAYDKIFNL